VKKKITFMTKTLCFLLTAIIIFSGITPSMAAQVSEEVADIQSMYDELESEHSPWESDSSLDVVTIDVNLNFSMESAVLTPSLDHVYAVEEFALNVVTLVGYGYSHGNIDLGS